MSNIKLAKIGVNSFSGIGSNIRFLSNDYLLDYDFILVSTSAIIEEVIECRDEIDADYDGVMEFFKKRTNDLKEFYHYGGCLVLMLDQNPVYATMEGISQFKNGKLINLLSTQKAKIRYVLQNGYNLKYKPVLSPFTDAVNMNFKAILNHNYPDTLLYTMRTEQPLSYHRQVGNGFFLAMPGFTLQNPYDSETNNEVFNQLVSICQTLKQPQAQLA